MYILILTICGYKGNFIYHIPGFTSFNAADSAGMEWRACLKGPDMVNATYAVVNPQLKE